VTTGRARYSHTARACAALLLAALVAACARTPARDADVIEPVPPAVTTVPAPAAPVVTVPHGKLPRAGNPPFYDVLGRRYHVLPSGKGYKETGVASWYGREFHGRSTASGEPYDMHAMTAAHKTLPIPSYARVTNLRNGRTIVVRVNDRGPFVRNRILDLSYGAAEALDITHDGTGIVEVETIELEDGGEVLAADGTMPLGGAPVAAPVPEPPPPDELPIEQRSLYVQVGAFGDPFNAERMHQRLLTLGFDNAAVVSDPASERLLYRVRLGPLPDVAAYDRLVEKLNAVAIEDIYLTLD
jgi:rare lipoprotein A